MDRITDFASPADQLAFENAVFTGLGSAGTFSSTDGRCVAGAGLTSGQDSNDRIIYNTTNGNLYYDANGSASGGSVQIATLQGVPTLAASDITVI